jgi:hypothetical protein
MGQQPGQVAQALGVLEAHHRALIGDSPVRYQAVARTVDG